MEKEKIFNDALLGTEYTEDSPEVRGIAADVAELLGIGADNEEGVGRIKKHVAKGLNKQSGKLRTGAILAQLSPGRRFLLATAKERLTADDVANLSKATTKLRRGDLIQLAVINGLGAAGIAKLIPEGADIQAGICSFKSRQMPNRAGQIYAIKFGYAAAPTPNGGTQPIVTDVVYSSAVDAESGGNTPSAVPAFLLNSQLVVKIGQEERFRMPIKRMMRPTLSVAAQLEGKADFYQLEVPVPYKANESVEIYIEGAALGTTLVNTTNHYAEVRFDVDEIVA